VFTKRPDLLKNLVAQLLKIQVESIENLVVVNSEMPPEELGKKFCRLDINMTVDGRLVDLEIQVEDEGDYPERTLYYWAREYSCALNKGVDFIDLPRTIIISITAFNLFDCDDFHSEFRALEVTRHTELTDRMSLHYFELPKVPKVISKTDMLRLWLTLFKANTEEELADLEELGVPVMKEAIGTYRQVSATEEFRQLERLRERTRNNEAAALGHARRMGIAEGKAEGRAEDRAKTVSAIEEMIKQGITDPTEILKKIKSV